MNLEQVRSILNDITLPDGKQIRSANHPEGECLSRFIRKQFVIGLVSLTEMAGGSGI